MKKYLNRRLKPTEAAVVVLILLLLGGLGYAAYKLIAARLLEARINAALPAVCAGIRSDRSKIIAAIEAFKTHYGTYPPDHVLSRQPLLVDPITNTLLYELAGVIYNPTNKTLRVDGLEPAEEQYVKAFFQCSAFSNYAASPDKIIRFLKVDPLPTRQLHDDPDVFALASQAPFEAIDSGLVWEFDTSPWRYVASAPTNNPRSFDLWIELKTRNRTIIIGNWKGVE